MTGEVTKTWVSAVTTEVVLVSDHLNPIALVVDRFPDSKESEMSNSLLAGVPKANKPDAAKATASLCMKYPRYELVTD